MSQGKPNATIRSARRLRRPRRATLALPLLMAGLAGCELDSYFDPSVVGRWEMTPTTVPILDRIAIIEKGTVEEVEYSEVEPSDLQPEIDSYRIGSGDFLEVTIFDLFQRQQQFTYPRQVDREGYIDLPQIGRVYVNRMTAEEARASIEDAVSDLVADPLVAVVIQGQRSNTYTMIGSVTQAGVYPIPTADYRLLEALASAGAFNEDAEFVYIIRQVPLTDAAAGRTDPPEDRRRRDEDQPREPEVDGETFLEQLDRLGGEGGGSPSVYSGLSIQPENQQRRPAIDIDDRPSGNGRPPAIDLDGAGRPAGEADAPDREETWSRQGVRWMYLDGRWVQVRETRPSRATPGEGPEGPLVTQRVVRVPIRQLLAGDARYNVVVRPGDTIRVPRLPGGNIFLAGQVARPGTYQLAKQMTLMRSIDAAGGLSATGIPERVDLTRMVGEDRQATIRLNLRAIAEGTQPDLYLKENDRINVGTTFWALPLAVIRGGFRASYGFGFLLDRNFGNDVFGAPPTRLGG